jgi:dipeptidyl aminopeptidase/acylaminoacyl peptidase
MEIVTTRVPTTRLPVRQVGVLALILLIVAAMLAIFVGSRPARLPEPFGPAGNGLIAMGSNGDLYTVDPTTGDMTLLVGGPETDDWLGFTPDGTRGVFLRWGPDSGAMRTARVGTIQLAAGAQPTFVKKDVFHGGESIVIAPNGRELAFWAMDYNMPTAHISVAALDQSTFRTFDNVPVVDGYNIEYLAPGGRELVYVALSANGHSHDIRALDVTTGDTRPIVETPLGSDVFGGLSTSPDGKQTAYAVQGPTGAIDVHVVGVDGRNDRVVGHAPAATFEAWPQWDPQGHRLLIERQDAFGVVHPVIVDLNGGPDVPIETTISQNGAGKLWSPDGASILAQRTAADGQQLQQELWNAQTGKVTPVGWASTTPPAWQRVASAP